MAEVSSPESEIMRILTVSTAILWRLYSMSFLAVPLIIYIFMVHPMPASRYLLPAVFIIIAALILLSVIPGLPGLSLALLQCAVLLVGVLRFLPEASVSFGMPRDAVENITAVALQDGVQRRYRGVGFRARLASSGMDGCIGTASGIIYVISSQADVAYGDRLYLSGYMDEHVFYADGVSLLSRSPLSMRRLAIRAMIRERFAKHGEAGELALRLLLGNGEWGSYEAGDDARLAGLVHVLALSGMHLSILALMASRLLFFLPEKARDASIMAFLFFFTFLSGMRPSLFRAFLYRAGLRYSGSSGDAFMLSALLLFAFYPEAASDLGAQYSFIALGGIFLLSGIIDDGIRTIVPLPYAISSSLASSMSALLFSIPLTVIAFGSYTLGSVLSSYIANLLVMLYMAVSMAVLALPWLSFLLEFLFVVTSAAFRLSAAVPMAEGWKQYCILAAASLAFCLIGAVRRRTCRM